MKTCERAVRASAILAAFALSGGAFAAGASGDSYDFNTSGTLGTGTYAAITGNGTFGTESVTAPRVGKPIDDIGSGVLEIAGTVTYTNSQDSSSSGSSQVDFMFKVEPTDELENIDDATVQVALAVGVTNNAAGTTAPIKLWCKGLASGGAAVSASWVDLKTVSTGSWVRATLVMDYGTTKKCKVSLDGDYVGEFHFAGGSESTFVKSISMVGSTKIDDLVVSYASKEDYEQPGGDTTIAAEGQGSNVTYNYINKYGITVEQATDSNYKCANSGLTVAQKFEAGLDPTTDTKFELKTMTMSAGSVTVTFPGMNAVGKYSVKAKSSRNGETLLTGETPTKTDSTGENVNSATVTIPAEKQDQLLYFTVETVAD